jgi:hypothetical protein
LSGTPLNGLRSVSASFVTSLCLFILLAYLVFPLQGGTILLFVVVLFNLGLFAGCALDILLRRDLATRERFWWFLACCFFVPFVPAGTLVYIFKRNRRAPATSTPIVSMHARQPR